MRLNKYLSDAGLCSRREGDRLIAAQRVTIDNRVAVLGDKVEPGQIVKVDGKTVSPVLQLLLLALHKPEGVECTTDLSIRTILLIL